jgi:hypothetical protein
MQRSRVNQWYGKFALLVLSDYLTGKAVNAMQLNT